jgi:hypothetical protein
LVLCRGTDVTIGGERAKVRGDVRSCQLGEMPLPVVHDVTAYPRHVPSANLRDIPLRLRLGLRELGIATPPRTAAGAPLQSVAVVPKANASAEDLGPAGSAPPGAAQFSLTENATSAF